MNKYNEYDDNYLASLICENDENVKNIIYDKYSYIIDIVIKKHAKVINYFQIDESEIRQEASYGFSDGLNCFSDAKGASLKTFLTICIERRVNKFLDKYTTQKSTFLKDTLSLDHEIKDSNIPLVDTIKDENVVDPLSSITNDETISEIYKYAKEQLSDFEYEVFNYMAKGLSYHTIAQILDKQPKQIDNTIQRIKSKMKRVIESIE